MRVLLINPFYPISETPSPPLGLAYLAAALQQADIEVKILDLVVFPYRQGMLQDLLESFNPRIVGITAVTMTFDKAMEVVRDVKKINGGIITVMGGPHVTFCARQTLAEHPGLDVAVLGEGERSLVELARAIKKGDDLSRIKGIVYRRQADICFTEKRPLIENLDELPVPARDLLPLGRYRALSMPISMTTSRGCPFKCIFCVGRKMVGSRVRYRNPRAVVDELEYLSTLNFHQINIADDLFTAKRSHCLAVCEEILRRRLQVTWTSFARVDTVSDEVLTAMKAAGCSAVSFGIESANPQILKTIKKGITLDQVVAAVTMCAAAGITPFASFILGLPGETPQTIKETMDFAQRLKGLGLGYGFHLLAPFPGTEVREKSEQYEIKILTDDWSQYHANRAIVETLTVNRQMMDDIVIAWEDEYNQLLADIKKRIPLKKATPAEIQELENLERIVMIYDLMIKGVIEEKGTWQNANLPTSRTDALAGLVRRIGENAEIDKEALAATLRDAVARGHLCFREEGGHVQWAWTNFIKPV